MRAIPEALAQHLAGTATTVCQAWRVTRSDGAVLGFTEHDADLTFGGTLFLAASGFRASDSEAENGLSAEAGSVAGGFSSAAITEHDIVAGLYDAARVEVFVVNWAEPSQHMLLRVQEIGEVSVSGGQFTAELRRLTHRLDQVKGRLYGRSCDASLGDARCGVDVTGPAFRASGVVTAVPGETRLTVSELVAADGFFSGGQVTFESGPNAGVTADVETHRQGSGNATLTLWLPLPVATEVGDAFSIVAGCDKSFATCGEKFSNRLNFQGFPHMPGSDFALGYADGDTVHDGRALYE